MVASMATSPPRRTWPNRRARRGWRKPRGGWKPWRVTQQHRDDPGNGCVFAALGGDVARSSKAVRSTVTKGIRAQLGILERVAKGRSKASRREQAITALSGMVGAMVIARLVNRFALLNAILTVAASAFGGNKHDNQKRTAV